MLFNCASSSKNIKDQNVDTPQKKRVEIRIILNIFLKIVTSLNLLFRLKYNRPMLHFKYKKIHKICQTEHVKDSKNKAISKCCF